MKEIVCKYVREGQHAHTHTHYTHSAVPHSLQCYCVHSPDLQRHADQPWTSIPVRTHTDRGRGKTGEVTQMYICTYTLLTNYELFQCYCETACPISLPWPTQMMHTMHVSPVNTHTSLHLHTYVRMYVPSEDHLWRWNHLCPHHTLGRQLQSYQGAGCRVQNTGCKVQSTGCRVQSTEYRVQSTRCRVQSTGCRVQSTGCRTQDKRK